MNFKDLENKILTLNKFVCCHIWINRSHSWIDWSHIGMDYRHTSIDCSHIVIDYSHIVIDCSHPDIFIAIFALIIVTLVLGTNVGNEGPFP